MDDKKSKILMYQAEDRLTKIKVQFEEEIVWVILNQVVELFDISKNNSSCMLRMFLLEMHK